MPGRRSAILGGAAGAALALAACGGGDSSPSSPAQYVAQADKVCARFTPSSNRVRDLATRRKIYREVDGIEPPASLRGKVAAFRAANRTYLAALGRAASQEQDVAVSQAGARRGRLAAEVGFKRCGQPYGGQPLTTAGFLPASLAARADAVCKSATDVAVTTQPKGTAPADIAASYKGIAPAARAAHRRLAALSVPAANRGAWAAFLDMLDRRVTSIEEIRDLGSRTTDADFRRIARRDMGVFEREVALTRGLGLAVCGQSTALGV